MPPSRRLSSGRPRPRKGGGTLRPATFVNMSGLNIAACQATGAPQSWPTMTACCSPEGCDQRDHVADRIEDAVGTDLGGRAGLGETAHVGRHDMENGLRKRPGLGPPRGGQIMPA